MSRLARMVVAALGVLAALFATARPAAAAGGAPLPSGAYGVQLLSQTPWVRTSGQFGMRVAVNSASPATDRLQVRYFPQLITRTNFDLAADGQVRGLPFYTASAKLSKLPADPAGGIDIEVPVGTAAPAGSPFAEFPVTHTGVFPIQLVLTDSAGQAEGDPLTTFLVYASGPTNPLSVSLIVPVASTPSVSSAGRIQPPGPTEATRLSRLASVLGGDSSVRASVLTSPLSVTSVQAGAAAGSVTDRSTLAGLAALPRGGLVQVLPSTYSPVAPGDLVDAGLAGEADQQVTAGAATLQSVYGKAPEPGTWVVNGPLDSSTLAFLLDHHVTSVIVPNADLSSYNSNVTFASDTWLQDGFSRIRVMAADPQLSADFTVDEPPVLAANQLLAEMAMIQTEQPGRSRAVVAMPPAGWTVSPDFVATLLAGLNGNPLLRSVTASGLFSSLPQPEVTRYLADPSPAPGRAAGFLIANSGRIQAARRYLAGLSSVLPNQATVATLANQLLGAESETLGASARGALLGSVEAEKNRLSHKISLPGSTSITLTATKAQLPITILSSMPSRARVQLVLISQRLIFQPAATPDGSCTVPIPTREVCTFSLIAQNTTLKVPVETRSSGVFPLEVDLYSPNGMLQLSKNRDTVRSTAVSGVGLILIIVAVLSLAVWWGRDLRHGRRPGRLAPAPDSDGDDDEVDLGADPVVHEFFQTDPPEYHRSGRRTG